METILSHLKWKLLPETHELMSHTISSLEERLLYEPQRGEVFNFVACF